MPKKTKKTKTKKYKSKKSKKNIGEKTVSLTRGNLPGFPRKLLVKHKYCEQLSITSTTGVLAKYFFAANGMYDPNITGTGHQPMYFDQLALIYDHYCVIGSRIKIKILPDTTITKPVQCALFVADTSSVSIGSNLSAYQEQQTGKLQLMSLTQTRPTNLTSKWSAKKYFSGKSPLDNTDLQGTPIANPNELSYFVLAIQDITQALTVTLDFIVEIEYIAIWKEISAISAS